MQTNNPVAIGKAHVLIVDDNPILLRTVKEMIQERYSVAIAVSGSQAFMAIENKKPDIILLDYEMPYSDGADVIKQLHSNPLTRDIPVVFLTASADRDTVTKLISLNPAGYMLKPPAKQKLMDMIRDTLEKNNE